MRQPFQIDFSNQLAAKGIYLQPPAELSSLLDSLGLSKGQRVLVIIGGASLLSETDFAQIKLLFSEVLAPLAHKWSACVVDGGTDAGVMRLMGQARVEIQATFPLVGVAPIDLAILPDRNGYLPDAAPLEPHHTHFLLVPGSKWGDESPWIAQVASEIADGQPSVTILINGGEVSWKDASESIQQGRVLVVVAGSGRTADLLAAVSRHERADERAQAIVDSGLVEVIDLNAGREELTKTIEKLFTATE
jgi:hypothetical protein